MCLALMGLLLVTVCFFPGRLSGDSASQFFDAKSNHFRDWHPPLMAWFWKQLLWTRPEHAGLFFMHLIFFWSGLALVAKSASQESRTQIKVMGTLAAMAILTPPLLEMQGELIKDTAATTSLVLAFGALRCSAVFRSSQISFWTIAAFALFYSCGVRHNGFAAAAPLCFWMGAQIVQRNFPQSSCPKKRVLAGVAVLFCLWGTAKTANDLITDHRIEPSQLVMLYDLAGVSVRTGHVQLPSFYGWEEGPFKLEEIKPIYNPHTEYFTFWWANPNRKSFHLTRTPAEFDELRTYWIKSLIREPGAHLLHRLGIFTSYLGFSTADHWPPMTLEDIRHETYFNTPVKLWVSNQIERHYTSTFFLPWIYCLILGFTSFFRGLTFRPWSEVPDWAQVMLSSSTLNTMIFILAPTGNDFRYSYSLIAFAMIQGCLWTLDLREKAKTRTQIPLLNRDSTSEQWAA